MNNTLCISADTTFDEMLFQEDAATNENIYATEPMPAIRKAVCQSLKEEEWHTSFEEAISDRLTALHGRLSRLSNPTLDVQYVERNTDAALSTTASTGNTLEAYSSTQTMTGPVTSLAGSWRRITIFTCSAMMFSLLGFDVLGLLMLHVH